MLKLITFAFGAFVALFQTNLPHYIYNPSPETEHQVTENNHFSTDLFQQLHDSDGNHNKNLFISAYSISSALGMTYAGAAGNTAKEMEAVLHFGAGQEFVHRSFKEINQSLNSFSGKKNLDISISNQLWGQEGFSLQANFLKTVKDNYNGGLKEVDFNQPKAAAKSINNWVKDKTKNKITSIVTPGAISNAKLVLTNAIYFYGAWANAFSKDQSYKGNFELLDGAKTEVDYMNMREVSNPDLKQPFRYASNTDGQLLELPYHDGKASMIVMLPAKGKNIQTLVQNMNDKTVDTWLNSLANPSAPLNITLPKWKVAASYSFKKSLIEMGMGSAFGAADFSNMADGLFISDVLHKTFIDVSEEGTEAAAVTAVIMEFECKEQESVAIDFHATRPFLYFIKDNTTGSLLFAGQLVNPSAK